MMIAFSPAAIVCGLLWSVATLHAAEPGPSAAQSKPSEDIQRSEIQHKILDAILEGIPPLSHDSEDAGGGSRELMEAQQLQSERLMEALATAAQQRLALYHTQRQDPKPKHASSAAEIMYPPFPEHEVKKAASRPRMQALSLTLGHPDPKYKLDLNINSQGVIAQCNAIAADNADDRITKIFAHKDLRNPILQYHFTAAATAQAFRGYECTPMLTAPQILSGHCMVRSLRMLGTTYAASIWDSNTRKCRIVCASDTREYKPHNIIGQGYHICALGLFGSKKDPSQQRPYYLARQFALDEQQGISGAVRFEADSSDDPLFIPDTKEVELIPLAFVSRDRWTGWNARTNSFGHFDVHNKIFTPMPTVCISQPHKLGIPSCSQLPHSTLSAMYKNKNKELRCVVIDPRLERGYYWLCMKPAPDIAPIEQCGIRLNEQRRVVGFLGATAQEALTFDVQHQEFPRAESVRTETLPAPTSSASGEGEPLPGGHMHPTLVLHQEK